MVTKKLIQTQTRKLTGAQAAVRLVPLVVLWLGSLLAAACSDKDPSQGGGQKLQAQTLFEERFDSGAWPDSLTKPDCVALRTRCEEAPFNPEATYAVGDVVAVGDRLYECASDGCDDGGNEPETGSNAEEFWTPMGACTPDGYAARLLNTCEVETTVPVSTVGYENVRVQYEYRTSEYEAVETIAVYYSLDGHSWKVAATHVPSSGWATRDVALPETASGAQKVFVKVVTTANGDSGVEAAFIDNILVTADAPVGCVPAILCEDASAVCGTIVDETCGDVVCGNCGSGEVCSNNSCTLDCSPEAVCAGASCGEVESACGTVDCGSCSGTDVCVDGSCYGECSPEVVCAANELECGSFIDDACGEVDCGGCGQNGECVSNQCEVCGGLSCDDFDATCGTVVTKCGNSLSCGKCAAGEVCSIDNACEVDTCPDCGPLTAGGLAKLENYIDCSRNCSYGKTALLDECLAECGGYQEKWDKNRDGKIDEVDRELALLEMAHDPGSQPTICIENGAVVPIQACGLQECTSTRSASECEDADGDGLLAFQEELVGTSDDPDADSFDFVCGEANPCESFSEFCGYLPAVNRYLCQTRPACEGLAPDTFSGQCTAFHLQEVAHDADEVIVQVYYDHSPLPATVLDLRLTYDDTTLVLADARPIGALAGTGKQLEARHVSEGKLRLTVVGTGNTAPIPKGPIAELLFVRLASETETSLGFSVSDYDQKWSIAPEQGVATAQLAQDSLWGAPAGNELYVRALHFEGAGENADRTLLHFSFDNPNSPLDLSRAPSGDDLCELSPNDGKGACYDVAFVQGLADNADELESRRIDVARFDAMQRGRVQAGRRIEGVVGPGIYLDGISDHLEMPVTISQVDENGEEDPFVDPTKQSFSFSTWFYAEEDGTPDQRQILWSHNSPSLESTQYAVVAVPRTDGSVDLEWLSGDVNQPDFAGSVAVGLESLRWYHFAVSFDAPSQEAKFYVDGQLQELTVTALAAPSCPESRIGSNAGGIRIHEEGELGIQGIKPEQIFFTAQENQLYGIEAMDPTGLARREIRRTGVSSAPDVDYLPSLDRIVFSSTQGGNTEIWTANGDGSQSRQVTTGFGDTERGIFARRPRWVPDGTGIVFESNIYDLPQGDNPGRVYRLFYLAFDPAENEFAIANPSGGEPLTSVDYRDLVTLGAETLGEYALTSISANSFGAQIPFGSMDTDTIKHRGEVWYTEADANWNRPRLGRLQIPEQGPVLVGCSEGSCIDGPVSEKLLAASRYENPSAEPDVETIRLVEQKEVIFGSVNGYSVAAVPNANGMLATVTYDGTSHEAGCWEADGNPGCALEGSDLVEDLNNDGVCDVRDCDAADVSGLILEYPSTLSVERGEFDAVVDVTPTNSVDETPLEELGKKLKLSPSNSVGVSRVRIEVLAGLNVTPMPPGTVLGTFNLLGAAVPANQVTLTSENVESDLVIMKDDVVSEFVLPGVENVTAAAFSPDGRRLVLSVIEHARPAIVTTTVDIPEGESERVLRKISVEPTEAESLQWVSLERSFPCNWVGAHRDPLSKMYQNGFRGGIDEVKLHSYARSFESIHSEALRGHERLEHELVVGAKDPVSSGLPTCDSSHQCPPYQLCKSGKCEVETCEGDSDCSEGACVLASSVGVPGGSEGEYVCSVECSLDGECYQQQCLNGPCRFCMDSMCGECRTVVKNVGTGLKVREVEGCPDRNSFFCNAGTCESDCYSFQNGQSLYLCDPSLEYCDEGRCRLIEWEWSDLSPATFSALGDMFQGGPIPGDTLSSGGMASRTAAIDQMYTIAVEAYGNEDYVNAPRVLVQGKVAHTGGPTGYGNTTLFGGAWFDVGEIMVYAQSETQIPGGGYTIGTPYPLSHVRLLLVQPPMWNRNLGSTGRGSSTGGDDYFCSSQPGSLLDLRACDRRPSGSRSMLGYSVGSLPFNYECEAGGNCPETDGQGTVADWLRPGQSTVVVTKMSIAGNELPVVRQPIPSTQGTYLVHRACSYEGYWSRVDQSTGRVRNLWFGDPRTAISNESQAVHVDGAAAAWFAFNGPLIVGGAPDVAGNADVSGIPLLLNCTYAPEGGIPAGLEWGGIPHTYYTHPDDVPLQSGAITETATTCKVENGTPIPDDCYEWAGGTSMDIMNTELQLYQTLELQEFTSFGYDQ